MDFAPRTAIPTGVYLLIGAVLVAVGSAFVIKASPKLEPVENPEEKWYGRLDSLLVKTMDIVLASFVLLLAGFFSWALTGLALITFDAEAKFWERMASPIIFMFGFFVTILIICLLFLLVESRMKRKLSEWLWSWGAGPCEGYECIVLPAEISLSFSTKAQGKHYFRSSTY